MPDVATTVVRAELDVRVGQALAPVLARVIAVLAARAELGVDRIGDALLASDTLAAGSGSLVATRLHLSATAAAGRLELQLGLYPPGGARRLVEARRVEGFAVLERLVDELTVVPDGEGERLRLAFTS
jgi:hypothetical protein